MKIMPFVVQVPISFIFYICSQHDDEEQYETVSQQPIICVLVYLMLVCEIA